VRRIVHTLTQTLRAQHRRVEKLAARLTTALHGEDLKEVRAAFQAFCAALEQHLALEDGELYPRLLSSVEPRSKAARVAKTFSENMQRISAGLHAFIARHATGQLDPLTLRREWKEVLAVLTGRIQSEEQLLYPMFEQRFGVRP